MSPSTLFCGKKKSKRFPCSVGAWGTVTGGAFAAKFPKKVLKLVLFAPIFTGLNSPAKLDSYHVNTPEHAAEDFQKLPDGTLDTSITEPELVKSFVDQCMTVDGKGSPNGLRVPLLGTDSLIDLDRIGVPVLIIAGSRDPYLNRSVLDERMSRSPGKETYALFEDAGHAILFEKSHYRKFRNTLAQFSDKKRRLRLGSRRLRH